MKKYIVEILDEINEDPTLLEMHKDDVSLKVIFEYAFLKEKKFLLPEGVPPYKEDACPLGMNPTNLRMELRRLYIFLREDLSPLRREALFIELLEGVHPSEAKLLIAIKDQKLHRLYKKITYKRVADAGFVKHPLVK